VSGSRIALRRSALLLILSATVAGAKPEQDRDRVGASSSALRSLEIEEPAGTIPEEARPLLITLKRGLRDLIQAGLESSPRKDMDAKAVRARVVESISRQLKATRGENGGRSRLGTIEDVTVEFPPGLEGYAVAKTTVSIPCGSDSSLYVFQRDGTQWKLVLAQEAPDNRGIEEALHNLSYAVIRPEIASPPVVLSVNENASCSSCWQSLRLKLMRPGSSPDTPQTLWRRTVPFFYRCDGYVLKPTESGFHIEFTDSFDDPPRRIQLSIHDGKATLTESVRSYGSLREIYHEGQTGEAVKLADLVPDSSLYAVGAIAGLAGEITIVGGKAHLSYPAGANDTRTEVTTTPGVGATLLVTADVEDWRSVEIERAIPFEGLDQAIVALAVAAGIPKGEKFPFLIEGEVQDLAWHVIDGKRLAPGAAGHQAHLDASVQTSAERTRATLVGFYSESDEGVFTHRGSRTHVHCVVEEPLSSGHVDHVVIPAGTTIRLPIGAKE
jgi:hypothetical protein